MTKYCSECGKKLKQAAKFCESCGHSLVKKVQKAEEGKEWSQETKTICGVLIAVAVIGFVLVLFWFFSLIRGTLERGGPYGYDEGIGEVPVNKPCVEDSDCLCTQTGNILCNSEIGIWRCNEGECEYLARYS